MIRNNFLRNMPVSKQLLYISKAIQTTQAVLMIEHIYFTYEAPLP